jgi:hypothetical protein
MILSVEHSELVAISISLREKLHHLPTASYLEYIIRSAKGHVDMAIEDMKRYENQLNVVERTKNRLVI